MTTHFLFRLLHIGRAHSILSILQFVHGLPDIVTSHRTLRALQTPQALLARFLPRRNRTTLSISVFWSRSFAGCFCCWSTLSRELLSMIPSRGCNCSILNSENIVEVNILLRLKVILNYHDADASLAGNFVRAGSTVIRMIVLPRILKDGEARSPAVCVRPVFCHFPAVRGGSVPQMPHHF